MNLQIELKNVGEELDLVKNEMDAGVPLRYITLRYIAVHYVTLHFIALHYITLRYMTLHYTSDRITLYIYIYRIYNAV